MNIVDLLKKNVEEKIKQMEADFKNFLIMRATLLGEDE